MTILISDYSLVCNLDIVKVYTSKRLDQSFNYIISKLATEKSNNKQIKIRREQTNIKNDFELADEL